MKVTLVVTPGTAGPNGFDVDVTDFDSGAPLDATDVSLRFEPVGHRGRGREHARSDAPRRSTGWRTASQVSIAGVWTITVVVQTASSGTEIPLTLVTSLPDQSVSVATAAGQPDIYTIAFPDGEQLQMYNDPGTAGHGRAPPHGVRHRRRPSCRSRAPSMVAVAPDGTASTLPPRRFSAGPFRRRPDAHDRAMDVLRPGHGARRTRAGGILRADDLKEASGEASVRPSDDRRRVRRSWSWPRAPVRRERLAAAGHRRDRLVAHADRQRGPAGQHREARDRLADERPGGPRDDGRDEGVAEGREDRARDDHATSFPTKATSMSSWTIS